MFHFDLFLAIVFGIEKPNATTWYQCGKSGIVTVLVCWTYHFSNILSGTAPGYCSQRHEIEAKGEFIQERQGKEFSTSIDEEEATQTWPSTWEKASFAFVCDHLDKSCASGVLRLLC